MVLVKNTPSAHVPVPHGVEFRGKIVPYTRGGVAGKNEQDPALAETN